MSIAHADKTYYFLKVLHHGKRWWGGVWRAGGDGGPGGDAHPGVRARDAGAHARACGRPRRARLPAHAAAGGLTAPWLLAE